MRFLSFIALLWWAVAPLCAQTWTEQDSLHLQQLLQGEGELRLNPEALKELEQSLIDDYLLPDTEKAWLEFDTSLPALLHRPDTLRLTLMPYTTNTRYDWDPVYRRKIKIDKDTWRTASVQGYTSLGGFPLRCIDAAGAVSPSGLDFMAIFTKDFWNVKKRKRRQTTLRVLKDY